MGRVTDAMRRAGRQETEPTARADDMMPFVSGRGRS